MRAGHAHGAPGGVAAAAIGALAASLVLACAPTVVPGADAGHGVLLIAVDGLRADHLASDGYDRRTMPRFEQLLADGVRFEDAFAAAPQRVPSHAALLTGCDPNLARRRVPQWLEASLEQPWLVPTAVPRLSASFLLAGAATAAFVDHPDLSVAYGFAAGFQSFERIWDTSMPEVPRGERPSTRALQWVRSLPQSQDWFAYVHLADLERTWSDPDPRWDTYFEPRPGLEAVPPVGAQEPAFFALPPSRSGDGNYSLGQYEARYDGALRRLDDALHRMFEGLAAAGRLEHTTVCLVGTYGVQFGEAGLYLSAGRLSVADLRVPFFLRPAPARFARPPSSTVPGLASLIDVAPTLLELAGHPVPPSMQGMSLWSAARDGTPSPRPYAFASCGIQSGYAAFDRHLAMDVLVWTRDAPRALVTGWFGDLELHVDETHERFYPWKEHAFPPLWVSLPQDSADAGTLRGAALAWARIVEDVRTAVQEPLSVWDQP